MIFGNFSEFPAFESFYSDRTFKRFKGWENDTLILYDLMISVSKAQ